jgi:hypothetical protein
MTSEFGKGLTYNLGLFLAHSERTYYCENDIIKKMEPRSFFYTSSDHLYDLQIDSAPIKLRKRIKKFRDFCFERRLYNGTQKEVDWSIQEAKNLLRLIDKENGIQVEKGEFE